MNVRAKQTEKRELYKDDWRVHTIVSGDTDATTAWGLWTTSCHVGLHLSDLYPTEGEAMSAARESLGKGWADMVIVRRVALGPCVTLRA
jgi:hypothetical protein